MSFKLIFAGVTGREAALEGMEHWMKYTCLQFVPKESDDSDYIQFVERDGCVQCVCVCSVYSMYVLFNKEYILF